MALTDTQTAILGLLDKIDAGYLTGDLTTRFNKYADPADGMTPILTGSGDLDLILAVGQGLETAQSLVVVDKDNYAAAYPFFAALDAYFAKESFANLDAYLTAQNETAYTMLAPPNAAYLYFLYASNGSRWSNTRTGTKRLTPANVFAPVATLATATIGAAGAVTFTAGATIPTTNSGSNVIQGTAPAKGIAATATAAVNGTESIHVTYNGWDSTGTAFTGHVGTLVVDSLALNATTASGAWTPQAAGERVSAIITMLPTGSPSATAGAITVKSIIERVTS